MKKGIRGSGDFWTRQGPYNLFHQLDEQKRLIHTEVSKELGFDFSGHAGWQNIDMTLLTCTSEFEFAHKLYPEKSFVAEIRAFVTGSEFVVTAKEPDRSTEIFRVPINAIYSWDDFRRKGREYLLGAVIAFFTRLNG